jgi:hypothetical protein
MTIAPVAAAPLPAASGAAAARVPFRAAQPPAPRLAAVATTAPRPHPAATALASIERAQARLDQVLAQARAGKTFTSGELLALQAEAYRCAQVVDLGAKLAEQGAQAVKQALNTQL